MSDLSADDKLLLAEEQIRLHAEQMDRLHAELWVERAARQFAEARLAWLHRTVTRPTNQQERGVVT